MSSSLKRFPHHPKTQTPRSRWRVCASFMSWGVCQPGEVGKDMIQRCGGATFGPPKKTCYWETNGVQIANWLLILRVWTSTVWCMSRLSRQSSPTMSTKHHSASSLQKQVKQKLKSNGELENLKIKPHQPTNLPEKKNLAGEYPLQKKRTHLDSTTGFLGREVMKF